MRGSNLRAGRFRARCGLALRHGERQRQRHRRGRPGRRRRPGLGDRQQLRPGEVGIWHGNGAGGFTQGAGSPESTVKFPSAVRLADFNARRLPGRRDRPTTSSSALPNAGGRLLLHKGDPAAAAPLTGILNTFTKGDAPQALDVADVNGDSKPDVVVANSTSPGSLAVHREERRHGLLPRRLRAARRREPALGGGARFRRGRPNRPRCRQRERHALRDDPAADGTFSEATGSPFAAGTTACGRWWPPTSRVTATSTWRSRAA